MNPAQLTVSITSNERCQVTQANGRTFLSTPRAVGLALVGSAPPHRDEAVRSMRWVDLLASNGTLFGRQGQQEVTVAIMPRRERQIIKYPEERLTVSFPPTLIGIYTDNGRFVRGMIMCADMTRQAEMGVVSTVPLLVPFPFGNVYADSGFICWGTVNHSDIHSIHDLESLFFGSGFNTDLFNRNAAGVPALVAGIMPDIPPARFNTTFPTFIGRLIGR